MIAFHYKAETDEFALPSGTLGQRFDFEGNNSLLQLP